MNRSRIFPSLFAFAFAACTPATNDPVAEDSESGSNRDESSSGGSSEGDGSSGGEEDSTTTTSSSSSTTSSGTTGSGTTTGDGTTTTTSTGTSADTTMSGATGTGTGTTMDSMATEVGDETSGTPGEFTLMSAEFMDGEMIPDAHTCASGSFQDAPSPSFSWTGAPAETQSFAMVMIDKTLIDMDVNNTQGYHSAFWNLPASVTQLPVGFGQADLSGAQVFNRGYLGPCPLLGTVPPPHTYVFTLYALPDASITLGTMVNAAFVQTLEDAALATATLSGTSSAGLP